MARSCPPTVLGVGPPLATPAPLPTAETAPQASATVTAESLHAPSTRPVLVADQVVVPRLAGAATATATSGPAIAGTTPLRRDQAITVPHLRHLLRPLVRPSRAASAAPTRATQPTVPLLPFLTGVTWDAALGHLGRGGPLQIQVGRDKPVTATAGVNVPAAIAARRDPRATRLLASQVPTDPRTATAVHGPGRLPLTRTTAAFSALLAGTALAP